VGSHPGGSFTESRSLIFKQPDPDQRTERGDIIVFIYPRGREQDYIKRVIECRDKIQMQEKQIAVMASPSTTNTVTMIQSEKHPQVLWAVVVPKDHYFVMGDN
jgi:signal peptidase I